MVRTPNNEEASTDGVPTTELDWVKMLYKVSSSRKHQRWRVCASLVLRHTRASIGNLNPPANFK